MSCEKAVLISIRPEWVERILSGAKTVEVRKTVPKIKTPFKCYIYCTRAKRGKSHQYDAYGLNGKPVECGGYVVAEFTCNDTHCIVAEDFIVREDAEKALKGSGLTPKEAKKYAGWEPGTYRMDCKPLYGWRISALKVYEKPRDISEFTPNCIFLEDGGECQYRKVDCNMQGRDYNPDGSVNVVLCKRKLQRPPQSWCYVEEITYG